MCLHDEGVSTIRTASDHVYRPSGDLQSDHDEFVENEGGEGDRDDVEKFVLEKYKRHDHDSAAWEESYQPLAMVHNQITRTLVYTNQEPGEECLVGELTTLQMGPSQQRG